MRSKRGRNAAQYSQPLSDSAAGAPGVARRRERRQQPWRIAGCRRDQPRSFADSGSVFLPSTATRCFADRRDGHPRAPRANVARAHFAEPVADRHDAARARVDSPRPWSPARRDAPFFARRSPRASEGPIGPAASILLPALLRCNRCVSRRRSSLRAVGARSRACEPAIRISKRAGVGRGRDGPSSAKTRAAPRTEPSDTTAIVHTAATWISTGERRYTAPATSVEDARSGIARLQSSQTTAAHRENYEPRRGSGLAGQASVPLKPTASDGETRRTQKHAGILGIDNYSQIEYTQTDRYSE